MAIPKIRPAGGGERAQYLLRGYNDNTIRFVLNIPALWTRMYFVKLQRLSLKAWMYSTALSFPMEPWPTGT